VPRLLRWSLLCQGRASLAVELALGGVGAPEEEGGPEGRRLLSGEGLAQSVPLHERSLHPLLRVVQDVVRLRGVVETWGVEGYRLDEGGGEVRCRDL
jgi:hypothetical protein